MFIINPINCQSQTSLCDSIIDFYWDHTISYDFVFTYYSSISGTDVTKGSVVGFIDKDTQYRITLDSIENSSNTEYMGIECVKNKHSNIIGCNFSSDSSFTNFERDREGFNQLVGLYQPDHIFAMDKFAKMFTNKKKYKVDVKRTSQYIFVVINEIPDTNSINSNSPKTIKAIYEYKISKIDYSVSSLKYHCDFKVDGVLFQDSSEMVFKNRNPSKAWKDKNKIYQYICSFKRYRKSTSKINADPQDTITYFPNFILMDSLKELFRSTNINSRYTLVEFWYKGCLPCMNNIKKLNTIRASFDRQFMEIIGINDVDKLDSDTKRFIAKFHPKYTILFNGKYLRDNLHITAHPSTYIYDNKTRKVLYYKKGTDENYVEEIIEALGKKNKFSSE